MIYNIFTYLDKVNIKKILSFLTGFCFSLSSMAQVPSQYKPGRTIFKWEKVEVKKDFILSNSLMYHRFCRDIWKYQISEFKKKNPHIIDVDKFEVGDKIDLQLCTDFKFKPINEELKSNINQSFSNIEQPKEPKILEHKKKLVVLKPKIIKKASPVAKIKKDKIQETKIEDVKIFDSEFNLLFTFGGLAEQDEKTQAAIGFRVLANIKERIGYRMRLDYAPTVLMWHNELLIQTIPQDNTRYYIGYGLGNRMGIKENQNILLSNNTTGYTTVSLGTTFKAGKGQIDLQVGSNLSNHFSPFASIMAGKRLGDSPYILGGFIDYRSTRSSKEDTNADRHWMGAGIFLSY